MFIGQSLFQMIIFQKHVHVFKYAMKSLIWYILIFLNLTKMDRRQNEKKIYFLSVLSTVNTVFLMQYICKKKKISAFIFHFKQLQYLQAV